MSEQPEREQPRREPAVEPLLVRVEEAARILSLSRSTIYEMIDAGEIPSIRRGTARRRGLLASRRPTCCASSS